MPPTGVIGFWGSIIGGLATLGIVAALTSLQLQRSDEPPNDQTEDTTSLEPGLPPGEKESHSSTGQTSELDAFAEAEQALNQAKELVAGKGAPFLELPIGGLLDVVNACVVSSHMYMPLLPPSLTDFAMFRRTSASKEISVLSWRRWWRWKARRILLCYVCMTLPRM